MDGCRQNFNLFSTQGRESFFSRGIIGDEWARQFVFNDTFGKYICKLMGHAKTFITDDPQPEIRCSRCLKNIERID